MPKIKPFRGVVYNAKKIRNMATVVAPPYDIIPKKLQEELYRICPHNIVRIELNKITPSDNSRDNRYTRSQRFFESWLKSGIMIQDEKPAIYVYSQRYKNGTKPIERIGFIGVMDTGGQSAKKVLPHENTLAAPKTDRLNLIRKVKANLSPIFFLYDDPRHEIMRLLKKAAAKKPFMDVVYEGVRNRAWRMDDERDVAKLQRLMEAKPTFVADGHHRFEVSRMYAAESGRASSKYVMVYFAESDERTLTVLPAHRLVIDAGGLSAAGIRQRLEPYFRMERKHSLAAVLAGMRSRADKHVFGMYLGKGEYWLLTLKEMSDVDKAIKDKPKAWKELDVSILHLFIFQHALGVKDDDDNIEFVKSPQETAALVDKGPYKAAFFLNPTKVAQIKRVARIGEKMPRKATYFYPKPISGVVIHKH